jgi:hypothetical protein
VCEADGIQLENCPAYIREWIGRESGRARRKKPMNDRTDKLQKREEQGDGLK